MGERNMVPLLTVSEEIQQAVQEGKPVVALESTIISHGMPYPENVKMALEVEQIIRNEGAIPATIALLDGKIKVGLTREEIERLADAKNVVKASIRDLPGILAKGTLGATTVASTAFAANLANIRFFATGGLGGVHREVAETLDISADLMALASCNVCIVSAGVKTILDVAKTLEALETLGVPVYGYETDYYPGFYYQHTDFKVERITKEELVNVLRVKDQLQLRQCVHVAVPIPEEFSMDRHFIESIISDALREAQSQQISGKHVTPFLLAKIKEKTAGSSLKSNIALMKNNAKIAAQLAVEYSKP